MQLDSKNESWTPAHDAEVRLRSPWMLALGLALVALGTAALMTGPVRESKPRPSVAAIVAP
jgi:hypothetical protein